MSREFRFHSSLLAALAFGVAIVSASPHEGESMQHGSANNMTSSIEWSESFDVPNYFRHEGYTFWIYFHIFSMIGSWAILLPLSVMLSIAQSRFTILMQLCFFALNALGITTGIVYNAKTPDLYESNAHHKVGWIFTWTALVWILLGAVNAFSAKTSNHGTSSEISNPYQSLAQHENDPDRRWSRDSGQGTERNSSISSGSPTAEHELNFKDEEMANYAKQEEEEDVETHGLLRRTRVAKFLAKHVHKYVFGKTVSIMRFMYVFVERTIIMMGFIAICTGFVTLGGIFRGGQFLNGLAHFVKGGIFFWIGALAIARWAGAFADLGWAWNVKPPAEVIGKRKAAVPTSEFVESALICIYGVTNVWLEHLTAWGQAWSPMDYEHVSITILFFGGGMLGLLAESKRVRKFLNTSLLLSQPPNSPFTPPSPITTNSPTSGTWNGPSTSTTPLNPLPAFTILLLGIIMAAHTQNSALAATIHSMWGNLFAVAALARMVTYLLHYIKPPVSYLPGRPPSELITGFTLVGGGFMFMISPRDITDAIGGSGADAMVVFVVSMGLSALVCAGVVGCMAVKGWALGREHRRQLEGMERLGVNV
ncbi:hypothetical protein BT63DRAFT_415775 [Microthyrium microscopicum]|uniref:Integral membrane protein n=1 Tax=Microthyrium microscopicum TaxID=703497 RepID=A0A6A6U432_9PEZI|nr:hypothetical protein BT63DRAFT_415775 [Microthyrium microscopicum]